ncbi:hypothetical protein D9619_012278 [Psilocybe cf. subviscida]|uniref:Uncharacterized protein n=1 Tax=Psilocybe cf. subviscida TaxID=2480587 RepID=A0A8H5B7E9_9AGAR|nr:hypothetical protein D9619_012278 [Psilocybe cf. subviscida]
MNPYYWYPTAPYYGPYYTTYYSSYYYVRRRRRPSYNVTYILGGNDSPEHQSNTTDDESECDETLACLLCKARPTLGRYYLCGETCKQTAMNSAPLILEVPAGHHIYEEVEEKFRSAWKSSAAMPTIKKVYRVVDAPGYRSAYDSYKK